jgi:hypothetical protein
MQSSNASANRLRSQPRLDPGSIGHRSLNSATRNPVTDQVTGLRSVSGKVAIASSVGVADVLLGLGVGSALAGCTYNIQIIVECPIEFGRHLQCRLTFDVSLQFGFNDWNEPSLGDPPDFPTPEQFSRCR